MARIGAAIALSATMVVMLVIDALSTEYEVEPAVLVIIVTAVCTLLGVEFVNTVRRGHS